MLHTTTTQSETIQDVIEFSKALAARSYNLKGLQASLSGTPLHDYAPEGGHLLTGTKVVMQYVAPHITGHERGQSVEYDEHRDDRAALREERACAQDFEGGLFIEHALDTAKLQITPTIR